MFPRRVSHSYRVFTSRSSPRCRRLRHLQVHEDDVLLDLNGQETARALERRLRHYTRPALLVCDEVGYLGYDARAADLIFQLVSRRYEHRSLLITTNLPFKRWDTVFPNASCAVALIDRLTHHAEILLRCGQRFPPRAGMNHGYCTNSSCAPS